MTTTTFDALRYYERLKAAGVPEEQAKIQADAMRDLSIIQEENLKKDLSTKGDVRESELRLQKEIEQLKTEMKEMELRLLKWQWGIAFALAAIMAKGFHWIGF